MSWQYCLKNDYSGISKFKNSFFDRIVENGLIKWMFCGHDHLNTLSLIYKGIQITYGMSIDYLGYTGIKKNYTQRGGTLITRKADGSVDIKIIKLEYGGGEKNKRREIKYIIMIDKKNGNKR